MRAVMPQIPPEKRRSPGFSIPGPVTTSSLSENDIKELWAATKEAKCTVDATISSVAWHRAPVPKRTYKIDPETLQVLARVASIDPQEQRAARLSRLLAVGALTADEARETIDKYGWPQRWHLPELAAEALRIVSELRRQLLVVEISSGSVATRRRAIQQLVDLEQAS
jgi:hypothetical protein